MVRILLLPIIILFSLPAVSFAGDCGEILAEVWAESLDNPLYDPSRREGEFEEVQIPLYDEASRPPEDEFGGSSEDSGRGVTVIERGDYTDDNSENTLYW